METDAGCVMDDTEVTVRLPAAGADVLSIHALLHRMGGWDASGAHDIAPNVDGYEVLMPNGFGRFAGIANMNFRPVVTLAFGHYHSLTCTLGHTLYRPDGVSVTVRDLQPRDWLATGSGKRTRLTAIHDSDRVEQVYTLFEVTGDRYITNGLISGTH